MQTTINRFFSKIKCVNDCWNWTASKDYDGYGEFFYQGKLQPAHRASYKMFRGQIPEKMTIDHLCNNPSCVNPFHLQVLSDYENTMKGNGYMARNARKTHCPKGHEYNKKNIYYHKRLKKNGGVRLHRECRKCRRANS